MEARILVVDDDPAIRELVREQLVPLGAPDHLDHVPARAP
ncbi:MAG TPA: hypothetical protein PLD37_08680, partial [Usitatibacteraceae bacterium]|nr:hypothetical protein [Usitatibacteraceae bacterium]